MRLPAFSLRDFRITQVNDLKDLTADVAAKRKLAQQAAISMAEAAEAFRKVRLSTLIRILAQTTGHAGG